MFHYLPDHWRQWLHQRGRPLDVKDFGQTQVTLRFVDGSIAFFEYAFFAVDDERGELAVFTEHCGYHVFRLGSLEGYSQLSKSSER
jgi:hypothetical protein